MSQWGRFRVDQDNGFIAALLTAASKGLLSVPSKPTTKPFITPVPKPPTAAGSLQIRVKSAVINVRSGNGTEYQASGDLKAGQVVTLYGFPVKKDTQGLNWQWVDIDDVLGGWVCTSVLQWEKVEPPPVVTSASTSQTPVIIQMPQQPTTNSVSIPTITVGNPTPDPVVAPAPFVEISTEYALELATYYGKLAETWGKIAKQVSKAA